MTHIPLVGGHRLMFGVTTVDAVQIVQCPTSPSKIVVRNGRHGISVKQCAYIV